MTVADRLRAIVEALPPGAAVQLPVETVREWLAADSDAPAGGAEGVDLTVEQVAVRLGRAASTVREWCATSRLEGAYRMRGREWRIPPASLAALQRTECERFHAVPNSSRPRRDQDTSAWRRHITNGDGA